jgi:hypothetical protein
MRRQFKISSPALKSLTAFRLIPNLRTLQTGIQASDQLINDFKTAHQDGKTKLDKFMCDRVYSKKSSLHDRIGRSSRINFTEVPITKPSGEKLKVKTGEMERSAKVQKSKMLEKLSMQTITKPTPYTALVDMGLIWRIASPNTEDREKDDVLKYTW